MRDRIVNFIVTLYRGTKSSWKKYHLLIPPRLWKKYILLLLGFRPQERNVLDPLSKRQYAQWLSQNPVSNHVDTLEYNPLISVIIPVYNVEPKYLQECINSILNQIYQNFEICLVDDASTSASTREALDSYSDNEKISIKHRKKNGHISRASNDALKMAKGTFVALVDNDDVLPKNALYEVVKELNRNKKLDMIYSDEDKIDEEGKRSQPNFKPDFSPDTLMSLNYISHLCVLRRSLVKKVGGFRTGYEGAQDYDLYLRIVEKTSQISHIPKVLYHWRISETSTASGIGKKNYALERGKRALEDALKRRGISGKVHYAKNCPYYCVEYTAKNNPKVSIIIPTKDLAKVTEVCLKSIYEKTKYKNYEVIVVNNRSEEKETFELFERYKKKYKNFRVLDANFEFNYSRINNFAADNTQSDYIALLNNDIEVISPDWLNQMVGYASQKHVGAVGAKLLYPNNTVQHAGVVLGVGVASHLYCGMKGDVVAWAGKLAVPYDFSAVTGACLVVDRKKWNEVGGLEEKLKVAYNDIDFNIKLLKKGYYNVCLSNIELYHHESKSRGSDTSGEKKKRFDSEQNFMYTRWKNEIKHDAFYNQNLTRKTAGYLLDKKEEKKDNKKVRTKKK
ncbi:glycosyltransferase [Candidatus Saccharibacteria bacterium]|nr:glycosyltransferase [Candidatus Saccharibacteria bacterium]